MTEIRFDVLEPQAPSLKRKLLVGAAVLVAALLVWLIYRTLTAIQGVPVPPPDTTAIDMLPPPPPPPPPPPEPETKPPEPTEAPTPTPTPQPQPQAPAPMQIDSAAQAGTDSYGMTAGSGGGMGAPSSAGTCLGAKCGGAATSGGISDAFYSRYVGDALQERLERDRRIRRFVFTAEFGIWMTPAGAISKVELRKSSGDSARDQQIIAILSTVNGLRPPPPSLRFPQRISLRGKKPM